ncbi:MAG: flavodoxin-dependent (E)-4-hydroxy-3-methylbut-2-enyl-diphosphate synthase [Candidatus Sumerlaeia bacterium]
MLARRKTRQIKIGHVAVGGGAPVSVQSMCNTPTEDIDATLAQLERLAAVGCEIGRLAVPSTRAAEALSEIVKGCAIPLVADIHFDHRLALAALEAGIAALRINPGNIGRRDHVEKVVSAARERAVPIRIGVNAGSLEKPLLKKVQSGEMLRHEAMVESALGHLRILEELDFHDTKISLKASDVITTVRAYRLLAEKCDYPFHVGITEAGTIRTGVVKSSAGIGILLMDGLCDTIRVSLTGPPEEEVRVGLRLLQAMGERQNEPVLISCPTCGRTTIDVISLAESVEQIIEEVHEPIHIAVMGCEVNGPGEARDADLGVAGGAGRGIFFRNGEIIRRCPEAEILTAFREELDKLLHERQASTGSA